MFLVVLSRHERQPNLARSIAEQIIITYRFQQMNRHSRNGMGILSNHVEGRIHHSLEPRRFADDPQSALLVESVRGRHLAVGQLTEAGT